MSKTEDYKYMVVNISEGDDVGYKGVIPKFPRLYVVADSPEELHQVVQVAIAEEVELLKKAGKPVPAIDKVNCSGKFVLRTSPELHERLSDLSSASGKSLNSFVCEALQSYIA